MYNDKYRHTRDRLFGLALVREQPYNLKGGGGVWFFPKKNIMIQKGKKLNNLSQHWPQKIFCFT